jgi:hypothetical protein
MGRISREREPCEMSGLRTEEEASTLISPEVRVARDIGDKKCMCMCVCVQRLARSAQVYKVPRKIRGRKMFYRIHLVRCYRDV